MAQITGIVREGRQNDRFAIQVDGHSAAVLSAEAIARLRVYVGRDWTEVRDAVAHEAALLATYDRAVRILAVRARSTAELRRGLLRKGEPAAHVDAALARLVAQGHLEDEQFARQFARSRLVEARSSKRRVAMELRRKGISPDVAGDAIRDVVSEEDIDEAAIVRDLARRRLEGMRALDTTTRRRRLFAYLARRGYGSDHIRAALDEAMRETDVAGDHAAPE